MTGHEGKLHPRPRPDTLPFWEGCREGRLLIQRCGDCSHRQFYPRILCVRCGSRNVDWQPSAGVGTVETFTVVHVPLSPAYAADTPYAVALVRLDEGPRMMSNLRGCEAAAARIGMRVEVCYETWADDLVVPQFRPVDESSGA